MIVHRSAVIRLQVLLFLVSCASATNRGNLAGFSEHRVSLSTGIELQYVESGDPEGDVVVFLHGYTDSSLSFRPTIESLLARRPHVRALAVDLRGHGGSSMPPAEECAATPERCFRVEDLAEDVIAFLDALEIERAHLVGHSYGSMVAQDVALESPDRVASIVLLGTAARVVGNPVIEQFVVGMLIEGTWRPAIEARGLAWPADVYLLTPLDADSTAEAWLMANWVTELAADPAYLAQMTTKTARVRLGTWLGVGRAVLEFDNVDRLGQLAAPTLVLWATQDAIVTESDQGILRSALDAAAEGCRMEYVWKQYGREPLPASGLQESDLGHNFQWGAPEAVAEDLAAWLERGAPTLDLYYADPAAPRRILTDPGGAILRRSLTCPG